MSSKNSNLGNKLKIPTINKEPKKSFLRSSTAAKSHLYVMIAIDAKDEEPSILNEDKPIKKKVYDSPYYHAKKSHMHVLIKDEDEGPQTSEEDIHMTSLQIMINPKVKDEPHQFQQIFPKQNSIYYNPYNHINKPHTYVLMTSDVKDEGPNYYQGNTNMTSLQIMINPNVKDDEPHHPQQNKIDFPIQKNMNESPYHQSIIPHTHLLISSNDKNNDLIHPRENKNMSSLQIMINPNVKDESDNFQLNINVSLEKKKLYNPHDYVNKLHMQVLSDEYKFIQGNANMTSLQIKINPNVEDAELDSPEESIEVLHVEQKLGKNSTYVANTQITKKIDELLLPSHFENQGGNSGAIKEMEANQNLEQNRLTTSDDIAQIIIEGDAIKKYEDDDLQSRFEAKNSSDALNIENQIEKETEEKSNDILEKIH